jgi:gamma-glutamylcyclotransferase (GGCT)/AIG2-like uncharacterized protein YtfP
MEINDEEEYQVGVYGTLKKGFPNYLNFLVGYQPRGVTLAEGLMLHQGGFPMAVQQNPTWPVKRESFITVEVFNVLGRTLKRLDILEGVPTHYDRRVVRSHQFGDYFMYYGPTSKLQGVQKVIWEGTWHGPSTTAVYVDFGDGDCKPSIKGTGNPEVVIPINRALQVIEHSKPPEIIVKEIEIAVTTDPWKGGSPIIEAI